jgi:hypothetical protein
MKDDYLGWILSEAYTRGRRGGWWLDAIILGLGIGALLIFFF